MRRVIVWIALAVVTAAPIAAIEGESLPEPTEIEKIAPWERYPQALGAAFGPITGTGLHYNRWFGESGLHVAAGIIYLPPDQAWETTLDYNVGVGYQHRLFGDVYAPWLSGALYLFAGGHHRGFIPILWDEATDSTYVGSYQAQLGLGGGIGIELVLFEHFSIPAEVGYGGVWTITEPDLAEAFLVNLVGQVALRYRF
jgi:hypothetical protein